MVFEKIREKRFINKTFKRPLLELEKEIYSFKGKLPLAVCPSPTGNSWQGVLSATEGLFGDRVFQIPQYYSSPIYSKNELKSIAEFLINSEAESIVFSGFLPYFKVLIDEINKSDKSIKLIYHGSHTSVLEDPNASEHFYEITELLKSGKLTKVGLVKKDLPMTMKNLTGEYFSQLLLKTDESLFELVPTKFEGLNIGVLSHDMFRKNLYNQVAAALLHPEANVHLKNEYLTHYLRNQERLIVHGNKASRIEFLKLMGGMTMNYYVTFSECWGQFVNESLAMGVPCLTSNVSAVLDFDEDLKRMLVVNEFDNDYAIFLQSKEVLSNLELFKSLGPNYIRKLNSLANNYLAEFLADD